jgi:redox-regulated HSP33 family molecular chaperone
MERVNLLEISKLNIEKHEKLLLFVLKELGADAEPVQASLERLSSLCSLSRRKVNDSLKALGERELIEVTTGKGKASNSYKLKL